MMLTNIPSLGTSLKRAIKSTGLSQSDFRENMGMYNNHFRDLLSGKTN